ncbi:MAG: carbohydrate kinase family protein [candidate division KSB1 bacterium]|nr:carbohydrate kinase family protein [candidate division KSB1 bacterium]MDZ7366751.1 carbohydrate kinase family protein [candidate division KSB1 bacterium]MDZ7404764.1 carbohydrate kinase family protein [candidate division KSB1 bacterium]
MSQRLGVIGTFIRDTIITLDGKIVESIGGLYHTMAYLAHLVEAGTEIQPLCHVGDDFYDELRETLARFNKNILFDTLLRVQQTNTQVKLIYRRPETRDEVTSPTMPPIRVNEITGLAGCEMVLVNLISGDDITLEALKNLHQLNPSPLIYLDLHSLALGIDEAGRRYYRGIPDWPEWVAACDILQMNEREAATLAGVVDKQVTHDDLIKLGRRVVAEKIIACHLTLGSAGSLLFYRNKENDVCHEHCQPLNVSQVIDVIGCGDAFGAAFVAHFMRSKNFSAATHFANKVAGLNCTFMGSLTSEIFQQVVKPQLEALPQEEPR